MKEVTVQEMVVRGRWLKGLLKNEFASIEFIGVRTD